MSEDWAPPTRRWPWPVGAALGVGLAGLLPVLSPSRSWGGLFDHILALWWAPVAAITAGFAGAGVARVQQAAQADPALGGWARAATVAGVAALLASAGWLARGWASRPWADPLTVSLPVFSVLLLVWLGLTARVSWGALGVSLPHAGLTWVLVLQAATGG